MFLPRIPLFDWLVENLPKAKVDLANSSITGVSLKAALEISNFEFSDDFNLGKNDPFGAIQLRETLAESYGCNPNNIITSTGGSEANFIFFLATINKGDEIIVERPGYSPLWLVPKMLGVNITFWERKLDNGYKLDIERLKEKISKNTKLIVITNLHNPSGVMESTDNIKALSDIATDYNALLLIDEIFLDVASTPQHSAAGLESVVISSSVSKVYGIGGLRTGWIVAEEDIAKQCLQAKWQGSVASPYLSELLSAAVLKNGRDELISKYREISCRNFPIVEEWIENNNEFLGWIPPDGAVLCFPKYKVTNNLGSKDLGQLLMQKHGILISPGIFFGTENHFRLTFMNPVNELQSALSKITEVLQSR
jgi:aspartate/methionine/tyrosine aminotransferase